MEMMDNILAHNPLWIVDVGASGGIDPRWAKFTSSFKGILFEPDPREYDILRSTSEKNLIVLNSALSDSKGSVDFHLCRKQQVSSVYLPNIEFLSKFPDVNRFDVIKDIKIEADTLDSQLIKKDIAQIDFIKIDAQGHELSILKGGVNYLDTVIGLEIEVEFAPLYKNQPLFDEVDIYVRKKGFELYDLKRYYWKRKESKNTGSQKGQLVFGDALYFKNPEQVLKMNNITKEKIVRSIYVYLAYGYLDLAQSLLNNANHTGLLKKNNKDSIIAMLLKFEKRNLIPNFRGKGRIQNLFEKIIRIFDSVGWYSGIDKTLGNQ